MKTAGTPERSHRSIGVSAVSGRSGLLLRLHLGHWLLNNLAGGIV